MAYDSSSSAGWKSKLSVLIFIARLKTADEFPQRIVTRHNGGLRLKILQKIYRISFAPFSWQICVDLKNCVQFLISRKHEGTFEVSQATPYAQVREAAYIKHEI